MCKAKSQNYKDGISGRMLSIAILTFIMEGEQWRTVSSIPEWSSFQKCSVLLCSFLYHCSLHSSCSKISSKFLITDARHLQAVLIVSCIGWFVLYCMRLSVHFYLYQTITTLIALCILCGEK